MNPRIKELAKQARQIGEYVNYGQIRLSPEQFEQKFAELIVKECLNSISAHRAEAIDLNPTLDEALSLLTNDIKTTFGIS